MGDTLDIDVDKAVVQGEVSEGGKLAVEDARAFLQALDDESLRRVVDASQKVIGPWRQNPYSSSQWARTWWPSCKMVSVTVNERGDGVRGDAERCTGVYYVVFGSTIGAERFDSLEKAFAAADRALMNDGWTLSEAKEKP